MEEAAEIHRMPVRGNDDGLLGVLLNQWMNQQNMQGRDITEMKTMLQIMMNQNSNQQSANGISGQDLLSMFGHFKDMIETVQKNYAKQMGEALKMLKEQKGGRSNPISEADVRGIVADEVARILPSRNVSASGTNVNGSTIPLEVLTALLSQNGSGVQINGNNINTGNNPMFANSDPEADALRNAVAAEKAAGDAKVAAETAERELGNAESAAAAGKADDLSTAQENIRKAIDDAITAVALAISAREKIKDLPSVNNVSQGVTTPLQRAEQAVTDARGCFNRAQTAATAAANLRINAAPSNQIEALRKWVNNDKRLAEEARDAAEQAAEAAKLALTDLNEAIVAKDQTKIAAAFQKIVDAKSKATMEFGKAEAAAKDAKEACGEVSIPKDITDAKNAAEEASGAAGREKAKAENILQQATRAVTTNTPVTATPVTPPSGPAQKKYEKGKFRETVKKQTKLIAEPKRPWYKRLARFTTNHPFLTTLIGVGIGVASAATGVGLFAAPSLLAALSFWAPTLLAGAGVGTLAGSAVALVSRFLPGSRKERLYTKFAKQYKKCQKIDRKIAKMQEKAEEANLAKAEARENHRSAGKILKTLGVYRVAKNYYKRKERKFKRLKQKRIGDFKKETRRALDTKSDLNKIESRDKKTMALAGYVQKKKKAQNDLASGKIDREDYEDKMLDFEEDVADLKGGQEGFGEVKVDSGRKGFQTYDYEAAELVSRVAEMASPLKNSRQIMEDILKRNSIQEARTVEKVIQDRSQLLAEATRLQTAGKQREADQIMAYLSKIETERNAYMADARANHQPIEPLVEATQDEFDEFNRR